MILSKLDLKDPPKHPFLSSEKILYIICPEKVGKCSNQKKYKSINIRVKESTLTFLRPGCFVYHLWSCQGQRQKKTDECCNVAA